MMHKICIIPLLCRLSDLISPCNEYKNICINIVIQTKTRGQSHWPSTQYNPGKELLAELRLFCLRYEVFTLSSEIWDVVYSPVTI